LRPLPDLSDLPDLGSIFDPHQDDLVKHISDEVAQHNSLTSSLDQQQTDMAANVKGLGGTLDSLDAISDIVATVFDQLSQELDGINFDSTIAESVAADSLLSANLDGFQVDYGTLGQDLLQALSPLLAPVTIIIIQQGPGQFPSECPPATSFIPGQGCVFGNNFPSPL
jgi:hypothetical protein